MQAETRESTTARRAGRRWGRLLPLALCAALLSASAAKAEWLRDDATLRAHQQALLERTRHNPTDHDATFAYVTVSERLGDYEAAIGALERILYYNPSLVRAKYELGRLYFGMRSFDAAARYLREAGQSPDADAGIRLRVEALQPQAEKQTQRSRWSGSFQLGLRYQDNPTFVPAGSLVRLNGQDLLVARPARRHADGAVFGLATIANDYDLENQRGDVLETRFLAYGSAQFRQSGFDFGYVEASFGPRFGLPEFGDGVSIKPYVVGQTSALRQERNPYASSGGGGVSMRLPIGDSLVLEPGIEARAISVAGRDAFSTSTLDTGSAVTGYLGANLKVTREIDVEMKAVAIRADAGRPWQSFDKLGATFALNLAFDPPSELIAFKWKLAPFIGIAGLEFDGANPSVDPRIKRRDTEFKTGAVLDAPITPNLGMFVAVQYDRIDSNLPNYRQRSLSVLGGPTARF